MGLDLDCLDRFAHAKMWHYRNSLIVHSSFHIENSKDIYSQQSHVSMNNPMRS